MAVLRNVTKTLLMARTSALCANQNLALREKEDASPIFTQLQYQAETFLPAQLSDIFPPQMNRSLSPPGFAHTPQIEVSH